MEAAAVLLSLAMRDTEHPVSGLCGALTRLGGSLAEWRQHVSALNEPVGAPEPARAFESAASLAAPASGAETFRKRLENDVAICIQSLQFHDRLIQQLVAVRGLLASVVNDAPVQGVGFGAHRWEEMLSFLRERLSEDSQHHLFNLLLRTGVVNIDGRGNLRTEEGSVDLF